MLFVAMFIHIHDDFIGQILEFSTSICYSGDVYFGMHGHLPHPIFVGVRLQLKSVVLDNFFNSNMQKIQELAFTLFHVHACSLSIPAPVYYADLVC